MLHVLRQLGHDSEALKVPGLVSLSHRFSAIHIYPLLDLDHPLTQAETEWAVCRSAHHDLLTKTYCVGQTLRVNKLLDDVASLKQETRWKSAAYASDLCAIAEGLTLSHYFHQVWNTHPLFNPRNGTVVRKKVERLSPSLALSCSIVLGGNCSEYRATIQFSGMTENPVLAKLYAEVLTDYDPLSKLVNSLACAVMCTAIRDPDSDVTVNVLVPDFATAHALRAKFWDRPCVRKLDVFGEYALLGEYPAKRDAALKAATPKPAKRTGRS